MTVIVQSIEEALNQIAKLAEKTVELGQQRQTEVLIARSACAAQSMHKKSAGQYFKIVFLYADGKVDHEERGYHFTAYPETVRIVNRQVVSQADLANARSQLLETASRWSGTKFKSLPASTEAQSALMAVLCACQNSGI